MLKVTIPIMMDHGWIMKILFVSLHNLIGKEQVRDLDSNMVLHMQIYLIISCVLTRRVVFQS